MARSTSRRSGTPISPTVFLTAARCGDDGTRVYVTFDSEYTSKSKLYSGSQDEPYDIAVVVFDKPIKGYPPPALGG